MTRLTAQQLSSARKALMKRQQRNKLSLMSDQRTSGDVTRGADGDEVVEGVTCSQRQSQRIVNTTGKWIASHCHAFTALLGTHKKHVKQQRPETSNSATTGSLLYYSTQS